jgi:hypothetical protein
MKILLTLLALAFASDLIAGPVDAAKDYDGKAVYDTAMKEIPTYKIPGKEDERVKQYVQETSNDISSYSEDGWCSPFVAWCLKQNGYEYASYNTFEEWQFVANRVEDPEIGDVVIIPGHTAFFGGWLDLPGYGKAVLLLGGNQAHRVCVLPVGTGNVMCFMEPKKAPPGWEPKKHVNANRMGEQKLDDKTYMMSILEYQMKKEQRDNPSPDL